MKPTIKPTKKQQIAWDYLLDKKTKFLTFGGGAGGGKSWLGCEWLMTNCYIYPGTKWFIGREELSRLMKSSYITWTKVCAYHKIPRDDWKLNGQYNYIEFTNGSRIDLLDLSFKPSDPMYERLGSLEYTGGWIEEAGEVDFMGFDVLKSRIGRQMNKEYDLMSKIFITCNPKKNWLYKYVYKPWRDKELPEGWAFVQSLFGDNPYTAEEYKENLVAIKDKATKQRLMFGNWEYDDDPNVLMGFEQIMDLWHNNTGISEEQWLTGDIARYGQDKTVIYHWKGWQIVDKYEYEKQGLDQTSEKIKDIAWKHKIPYSHIIVDEDGVGGGVVDNLRGINGFVNNSRPIDTGTPENYQNLKTQCYYILADKVNAHEIGIETEDEVFKKFLTEELEQVKSKDLDKGGKLRLTPKDEVKEIIGRSPDYSDAMMMRIWFTLRGGGTKPKTYNPGITYKR